MHLHAHADESAVAHAHGHAHANLRAHAHASACAGEPLVLFKKEIEYSKKDYLLKHNAAYLIFEADSLPKERQF